jgi:DNA helicase-2/ATP-dependent DNA helicase PcrA
MLRDGAKMPDPDMAPADVESLLVDLTPPQREAATHVDGPLLIIAGAGSGKTRVLTRRVAYLIHQGIPPASILAITFTNKAAGEMKHRVGNVLARPLHDFGKLDQRWPTICTFHSLCLRILRHYAPVIGLPSNFTIYDSGDQTRLIKEALKMLDISLTNFAPASVHSAISNAKNKLLSPEAYARQPGDFYQRQIAKIYTKYQQLLKQNNALDFDDLLLRTTDVYRQHPDVLAELQSRFQYIMIDEYQDTNHAQYVLAHALALKHRNMCVVGDPDQCLPAGALIRTPDGDRPIEKIAEGDPVSSAIGWGKTATMNVGRVLQNPYDGKLVRICTEGGDELRATPNHLCFAKLRVDASLNYTYLMWKRGVGYRIGTTRGVRASKDGELCSGLQVRANQEVADAMWILHASQSPAACRFYEHYYSVRYGIPTMVFFVRGRRMEMTQEWIDRLYQEVDTAEAAQRLMDDLFIDRRYPHHRPGGVTRTSGGTKNVAWARRHVRFTVFGGPRTYTIRPWHEHRVQLVTTDQQLRHSAEGRFKVCDGARGTWRIETSRKDYDDGIALAREVKSLHEDMELISRARLTPDKSFHFMPASHIHPGMVVPVMREGRIESTIVKSVDWQNYKGPVYDLSVPETRNYIAGGIVVHNSIYAWRGADIQNILDFEKDYPDARVVRLEQNYRSTKTILAIASKLIANNTQRKDKTLWTENPDGERAIVAICQDEYDEAQLVTKQLQEAHEQGHAWNAMAIFYRMNALSRVMEDALRRANVPYQIARGVEFYNRKEIKDVLAYLRVVANPRDEVSLSRIVNVPTRGLGDQSVKQLQTFAVGNGISLWESLERAAEVSGVSARAANAAKQFVELVSQWRQLAGGNARTNDIFAAKKGPVQTVMEEIFRRSGMEASLRKAHAGEETGEGAIENVEQLINSAAEYDGGNPEGTLDEYLSMISLVSDTDHLKDAGGAVTLMTLHAAKGLEFPVVAMIGMEEGVLPHSRARGNPVELEEERRLCFVGITRAQQRLILTKAAYRTIRGLRERTVTSPFLSEMPQESLDINDRTGMAYAFRSTPTQQTGRRFKCGQRVRHPTFGLGRIVDINDMGPQTRAIVEFNSAGRKTLILEHARLEAVG